MTNFKKQIVSAAAAGAMFLNLATPALAGTEIVISGNGAGSDNWTTVNQRTETTVTQNNDADVTNNVNADADTGDNDANFNTGGNVKVETGDADVVVSVENKLNTNHAEVDCCAGGDTDVEISGNGAYSNNGVQLNNRSNTNVTQDNDADVDNDVDAEAETGENDAYKNTGGDVHIDTGDASSTVGVYTTANVNSAMVGNGSHHGSDNPSASFVISGNGSGSDNYIGARLAKTTDVDQENDADVDNDVDADAETGENDANFNTGGDVIIDTGDAEVFAVVDNAVNFNYADVDCGCTWDVLAKIAGNGAEGHKGESYDNIIDLRLDSIQRMMQDNDADLDNDLDELEAETGENEANSNTGEADTDPSIDTGDASTSTGVENSGNVNVVGDFDYDLPEFPEVDFSFNMAALWAIFGFSN